MSNRKPPTLPPSRRDYCFKNPRRALIDACPNLELPPATHPIGFGFAVSVEMVRLDNLNQRTERGVRCVESRSAVRVIKIVRQPTNPDRGRSPRRAMHAPARLLKPIGERERLGVSARCYLFHQKIKVR